MSNMLNNMEEILCNQISGFHQYVLTPPVHLNYVSNNLCEMLGAEASELLDEHKDLYAQFVHPTDYEKYEDFVRGIAAGEQTSAGNFDAAGNAVPGALNSAEKTHTSRSGSTHSLEYRLLRKDGAIIHVKDTITAKTMGDGTIVGSSVLTDITDIRNEHDNLRFLNDTIPCGFLRYTCEKQPQITYINSRMTELLRFPVVKDGEMNYLEMFRSNIFLMIPMEERRRFMKYLDRVYSTDAPIAGDMTLLRCDGTRAHVFGWVTKSINDQGEAEFQSVCMDITDRYQAQKVSESKQYLQALSDIYNMIFEFNLDANTVKCLHCDDGSYFKGFENIAMQIDDALDKWLVASVSPERQNTVRSFFTDFCQKRLHEINGKPPQITYEARSADGSIKHYTGMFIKVDDALSFYCCRETSDSPESVALKAENEQLRGSMRDLVMQFSDGIAAFEISHEGMVKPLYATENVYEFFGFTEAEWMPMTEQFTPIENFIAHSEASHDDFAVLLKTGEAEFSYFDYQTETERKIKAICSEKEPNVNASRYVMLYAVDENVLGGNTAGDRQSLPENRTVSIRTFGYFDVFIGDTPIAFRNKKSKELFALLVDRRGGYVTSEEAITFLWEDEPVNTLTLSRYRKVALRLKNTLEEYGISDVVEAVDGTRRIVLDKIECDLYDYLSGKEEYSQLFKGSYLTNYSWGETTLGELESSL